MGSRRPDDFLEAGGAVDTLALGAECFPLAALADGSGTGLRGTRVKGGLGALSGLLR
jgi:hypothetical protein